MQLTILALPFIIFGAFVNPYDTATGRCINVALISRSPFCFEVGSIMPDVIKYGALLAGFALIYLGRQQIRRAKGQK
jgi:hypothetical protein